MQSLDDLKEHRNVISKCSVRRTIIMPSKQNMATSDEYDMCALQTMFPMHTMYCL